MTPYEEVMSAIDQLKRLERETKKKLAEIERAKLDIVLMLCDKNDIVSEECKKILREMENENE